jgi:hypothetical protein
VIDKTRRHVVYLERFNQVAWELQYQRIIQIARRYRAEVSIDSTGIGDPIVQTLEASGLRLSPYKIGGATAKQQLIQKLRLAIEKEELTYPENPYTLPMLDELRSFEYTFTEGGVAKYSAPANKHDDCVISLALANWIADTTPLIYKFYNVRGI